MKQSYVAAALTAALSTAAPALAQSEFEPLLCQAAEAGSVVEMVYDKDASKGCLPRLIDVHQIAVGNNGQLYLHGWQTRGCTKGRDYESERIFRFDKIQSVAVIDGAFGERSQEVKDEGWDGCIGDNCFIDRTICE